MLINNSHHVRRNRRARRNLTIILDLLISLLLVEQIEEHLQRPVVYTEFW